MNNLKQLLPISQKRLEQIRLNKFKEQPRMVTVPKSKQPSNTVMKTAIALLLVLAVFTIYHITSR